MKKIKLGRANIIILLLVTILSVLISFPFVWMIVTSFKLPSQMFKKNLQFLPFPPTIDNYSYVLKKVLFIRQILNSSIVAIVSVTGCVFLSTIAAYGINRYRFLGRNFYILILLLLQVLPPVLIIIPVYALFARMKLVNTFPPLILMHLSLGMPFITYLLWGYFDSIPLEIEEASLIDGCSRFQTIWKIVIPLASPGIAAAALFAFIFSWQEYLFALTLTKSSIMRTWPVGLSFFLGFRRVLWGRLMAASTLVSLPIVLSFIYLQKFFAKGLSLGGVKE